MKFSPFKKKRSYSTPVIIILLAVVLSSASFYDLFGIRSGLISVFAPVQSGTTAIWQVVVGVPRAIINIKNLSQENLDLKASLKQAQLQLSLFEDLFNENQRLKADLNYSNLPHYGISFMAAKVIGRSADTWTSLITVNRGRANGLVKDLPVIVPEGLVGKIVEVTPHTAKVLLLIDPDFSIAAVNARSRDLGLIEGNSPRNLLMKYVGSDSRPQIGDKIVTSSVSGISPPGIPIGTISQVSKKERDLFYHLTVKPLVNFSQLEEVFIAR